MFMSYNIFLTLFEICKLSTCRNDLIKNTLYFLIFRLALYVYEYLLHVGAQKAAQTFLNEAREGVNNKILVAYMSANGGGGGATPCPQLKQFLF